MEFIAELRVRVQITARDMPQAQMVLKERHGFLVGGGSTAEAKEYFIQELRDFRSVMSGPVLLENGAVPQHLDKDKILGAKKKGSMHIHGVDVLLTPAKKQKADDGEWLGIGGAVPVQLDLPETPPVAEEPKPRFKRRAS